MKRAYINGILLDGTQQMEPQAHKVLLCEDGVITAVADEGTDLDGYEVIDLHGGYVMPGLINLHVHLAGNGKPSAKPRDNAALVRKILSNGLTRAVAYRLVCSYAKLELLGGDACLVTLREGKFHQVKRMLASRGKPVLYLKRLSMGPLTLDAEDENNNSLVVNVRTPEGNFLLTGDMTQTEEEELLDAGVIPQATVLKAGHHGRDDATGKRLVAAVRPQWAVISTSSEERPDTPAAKVMETLALFGVKTAVTQDTQVGILIELEKQNAVVWRVDWDGKHPMEKDA